MSDEKKFYLKDQLFNKEVVNYLSSLLKSVYSPMDAQMFEKEILSKFPDLELKERMYWIRDIIEKHIPESFERTVSILNDSLKKSTMVENFIFSPYPEYIVKNGCETKHLNLSLQSLGEFTQYFSSEFAIRDFINKFPEQTFSAMMEWSQSLNHHHRRFASEGLRPKLPWAKAISFDYRRAIAVLDNLYFDDQRYVTRSVANHLNDISKIDADLVVDTLKRWKSEERQNPDEMSYIIKHSLRTLVKKGDVKTLEFLGFRCDPKIKISNFIIQNPEINLGDKLQFSFDIDATADENLIVDYKIVYPSVSNRISQKVFKIKNLSITKDRNVTIEKSHLFRQMTTKKLYTGVHTIEIQINGTIYGSIQFNLTT